MKVMFIVQGEGRGHMTQALALKELYEELGHEVCCVIVGHNKKKGSIPSFFKDAFKCRVIETASPNFVLNDAGGVCLWKTIVKNSYSWWKFVITFLRIRSRIHKHQPDVVVNFYESIFGAYRLLGGNCKKSYAIGHQFMFLHPDYVSNKDRENKFSMFLAKQFTRLIGAKSEKIALSITDELPKAGIIIVPPILRKAIFDNSKPIARDGFILLYALGKGFGKRLLNEHPSARIEVFTEKFWPSECSTLAAGNIIFNQLDGEKFLHYMRRADMVVCTAGFETASEAAYLGKKVMMIPTPNHVEQYYNAWDFQLAGLARMRKDFDDLDLSDTNLNSQAIEKFRAWVDSYKARFISVLGL
jgi:uncharacterized protein (TIGR00661 family)